MRQTWWAWGRRVGGVAILAVTLWRVGAGPFLHGLSQISVSSLATAALVAVLTTVSAAWRWSLVSRALGVGVPLGRATAAYYRSQFLNSVLPGGVAGDVHRALAQGRLVSDLSRSMRSVAWERSAGQAVQVLIASVVIVLFPSPVRPSAPFVLVALGLGGVCVLLVLGTRPAGRQTGRAARIRSVLTTDLRHGLLTRTAWPGIACASVVVVAGHAATFILAARTAGVTASTMLLLPLVLLVMLAMALPTNIGGWGPREGVAAGLFGVAGLGAEQGVAAAAVYGVLALAATLPGAVVLVTAARRRAAAPTGRADQPTAAAPCSGGASGG